ncbi:hypothetical protein EP7_005474 [Isosphaeraceae bacterium EP7]
MAKPEPQSQLTPAIGRALRGLERRLRLVAAMRGLGTLMLAAAACLTVGMAADFAWDAPDWARRIAWIIGVGCLATIPIRTFVHAFMRHPGALALAALAERSDPALGDRLTAAVDLLLRPAGSPALVRATIAEAEARADAVDARRAVPDRAARRHFLAGLLALAPLASAAWLAPDSIGVLLRRALVPRSDLQRISRHLIEVTPGDREVALGDDVAVTARVAPRFGGTPPEEAWLEWSGPDGGNPRRARLVPDRGRPGHFAGTLPASMPVTGYRVRSGPAASRRHEIRGIEPPTIAGLTATVRPPAYTGRPTTTARDASRIVAFEGSTITLALQTKADRATLTTPGEPARPFNRTSLDSSFQIDMKADESGTFAIGLVDARGIAGRSGPARHLAVGPDEPPTAVAHGPDAGTRARPDDVLTIRLAAADDVAVASAELHCEVRRVAPGKSPSPAQMPIDLERVGPSEVRGLALLRLAPLGLAPGDVVACRVRVADNRPPPRGPNVTWADLPPLTIAPDAEPLGLQAGRRRRDATRERIDTLARDAATARVEVEQLRYAADAAARGNGRWDDARKDDLARRTRDVAALADRLRALAGDLEHDQDARFSPLAAPARGVAEAQVEPGRDRLERAGRSTTPGSRLDELRRADAHLAATRTGLDELRRDFDELARDDADRESLARLAEAQDALADRAGDLAKHRPAGGELDRLKAEQEALGRDVDRLVEQSPTLRAELLSGQIKEAGALANRAKDLARRNAEPPPDRAKEAEDARALAREAEQVGKSLADLADRSKDLSPASREPAQAAAKQLGRDAPAALDRAADALAGNRPDDASEARRKAGEALEGGARKATDLAGSLQSDYPELNIAEPDARVDPALAGAREALRAAAREIDGPPGEDAGKPAPSAEPAMRQAAAGLRAAAQPPRPGAALAGPAGTSAGKSAAAAGIAAPDLSTLPALARQRAGRAWGGLPPHLRAALQSQGMRGGYRDDYERLIRLYFREVAADPR